MALLACGAAFEPITTPGLKSGRLSGERLGGSLKLARTRVPGDGNEHSLPDASVAFQWRLWQVSDQVPLENHYEKASDSFVANLFSEHSTFGPSRWRKFWYTAALPFSILQLRPKLQFPTRLLRRRLSATPLFAPL